MKNDETINGVRLRKHYKTSTKISEDGLVVEKEFIDKDDCGKLKTYNPKIYVDSEGFRYIVNKQLGNVRIQDLVAECFCPPKPNDGKDYVLVHKDGNLLNDHYRNLEWRERKLAYPYIQARTDKQVKLDNGLTVTKSGEVYKGKEICKVGDCVSDRDLAIVVPIEPYVEYDERIPKWKRTERTLCGLVIDIRNV